MNIRVLAANAVTVISFLLGSGAVIAAPFFFSTGTPNDAMGMASRPGSGSIQETEAADDFVITSSTSIMSASFFGLLTGVATPSDISQVLVEIYRVFPDDSTNPPDGVVPTRVNSPSDVKFDARDSNAAGQLSFNVTVLSSAFSVLNSVDNNISVNSGGEGAARGQEVRFDVNFATPFVLQPDHYFFVPQVLLTNPNPQFSGHFLWLSGERPLTGAGGTTPFPVGTNDLQAWIRNADLDPDWLRVGTDVIGGTSPPTFNGAFSLNGTTGASVPEPATLALLGLGIAGLAASRRRKLN